MADLVRIEGPPTEDGVYWLWIRAVPSMSLGWINDGIYMLVGNRAFKIGADVVIAHAMIPSPPAAPVAKAHTLTIEYNGDITAEAADGVADVFRDIITRAGSDIRVETRAAQPSPSILPPIGNPPTKAARELAANIAKHVRLVRSGDTATLESVVDRMGVAIDMHATADPIRTYLDAATAVHPACVEFDRMDPADQERISRFAGALALTTRAELDVLTEREKQRKKWDDGHDDDHARGEIAINAAILAVYPTDAVVDHPDAESESPYDPWGLAAKYERDRRKGLVVAAALLIAEIERIDRATGTSTRATE